MLADSACSLTNWCITPHKTPRGGVMSSDCRRFNKQLSRLRIKIEHTIGRLNIRCSILHSILNKGNLSHNQLRDIYKWVGSAVVLHNFLHMEDPWDDNEDETEDTEPVDQNQVAEKNWDEDEDEQRNLGICKEICGY